MNIQKSKTQGNEPMNNQIVPQTVVFHNQELLTVKIGEVIYTAIRPIVEGMGLDWASQYTKLKKNAKKFNCCDIATVAEDGKVREMLCMPIKKLNGWLFSINPEKVKPENKSIVVDYQEECFEALYNYWHKGEAINPRVQTTTDDRKKLRQAVNRLVAKVNNKEILDYNDGYTMVNQYMGVNHIDEIAHHDLPKAIAYVHNLIMMANQPVQPYNPLPIEQWQIGTMANTQSYRYLVSIRNDIDTISRRIKHMIDLNVQVNESFMAIG